MVRFSLLCSCFAASIGFAQETANHEEVAMMKVVSDSSTDASCQDRLSNLESQMQTVFTDTALGNFGAKTASARPQIHSNRLFVKADAFLWKAFFGGNNYAATNSSLESNILTGDAKRADFRWRFGFRTQAGFHLPHDNWDLIADYTWFHDKADRSISSPANGTIVPLIPSFTQFSTNASASIRWKLRFQTFDFNVQRAYFLSKNFSMAPFFGLRNAWVDQKYLAHYSNPSGPIQTIDVSTKQDFWGIGPLVGMHTDLHLTRNWWFFGSFAGAILAADYDIASKVFNNHTIHDNIQADTQRLSPNIQGNLGLGWQTNFNRNRNHIALRASYEAQYWWKQNLTLDYASTTYQIARMGEDLGLHGFTLDMLFDF